MHTTTGKPPVAEKDLRIIAQGLSATFRAVQSGRSDEDKSKWLDQQMEVLFETATDANITSSHRTAACNVICGTVDKCLQSSNSALVSHITSEVFLDRLQRLYFERYHGAKEKSMKQALAVIVKVHMRNLSVSSSLQLLNRSLNQIILILFRSQDRTKAKAALHALQQYVSRDMVQASHVLTLFRGDREDSPLPLQETLIKLSLERFLSKILEWAAYTDLASAVGQFIACFLASISKDVVLLEVVQRAPIPLWAEPLMQCIASHPDHFQSFKCYILPHIFQRNAKDYWGFLQHLRVKENLGPTDFPDSHQSEYQDSSLTAERRVLFAALLVGKEQSLLMESDNSVSRAIEVQNGIVSVPGAVLDGLLDHISSEIRLSALALLVTSSHSTRPFRPRVLRTLSRSLPHFFEEADPNFRSEVQSVVQVLVHRLRVISTTLSKGGTNQNNRGSHTADGESENLELLECHRDFAIWFIKFLTSELHPVASYQRRISALKSLIIVLKSGLDQCVPQKCLSRQAKIELPWSFHLHVIQPTSYRALQDALLDPFDDVRQAALDCLKLSVGAFRQQNQTPSDVLENPILSRAQHLMSQSGRLDHSDGVARLYDLLAHDLPYETPANGEQTSVVWIMCHLLSKVENAVDVANRQLSTAVAKYPVHGFLTALKYLTEANSNRRSMAIYGDARSSRLLDRSLDCIANVWDLVNPVLCNDAPEGFLPEDLQDEANLTTKDVSSFAWRALKESSVLLRALICTGFGEVSFQDTQPLKRRLAWSGNLCFRQLAELRHRGAFSTVAQTFAAICRRCGTFPDVEIQVLVQNWYRTDWLQQTLALIEQKGSITTRRSAGIPALIVGVVAAGEIAPKLKDVILDLKNIAMRSPLSNFRPDTDLPQAHALNSLKAIFNNSALGEESEPFIVDVMHLAATQLGSDIWSIRNCGLMLFRGLIDRLLGTNESLDDTMGTNPRWASKLEYESFPGLLDLVIRILTASERPLVTNTGNSAPQEAFSASPEALFTVLDLIRRAPPSPSSVANVRYLVLRASGAPQWRIRDLAARTFAACIDRTEILDVMHGLLDDHSYDPNEMHGRLLCIRYAVISLAAELSFDKKTLGKAVSPDAASTKLDVSKLNRIFSDFIALSPNLLVDGGCGAVKAAYICALNSFGQFVLKLRKSEQDDAGFTSAKDYFLSASAVMEHLQPQSSGVGRELQRYHCLAFMIAADAHENPTKPPTHFKGTAFPFILSQSLDDPETFRSIVDDFDSNLRDTDARTRELFADSMAKLVATVDDRQTLQACETVFLLTLKTIFSPKTVFSRAVTHYISNLDMRRRFATDYAPQTLEHNLKMWGLSLYVRCKWSSCPRKTMALEVRAWIRTIKLFLSPSNDNSLRFAAIESIAWFAPAFDGADVLPQDVRLQWCLILYDALNDDDDEIRNFAADAVFILVKGSLRVQSRRRPAVPRVARKWILHELLRSHRMSPEIVHGGIVRFLPYGLSRETRPKSVLECLTDIAKEENVLFVVEKQNLYADELREAKHWSALLQRLPVQNASRRDLNHLTRWVLTGIDTLLEFARTKGDGTLGWTSNSEAFLLGMRIICGADTLLKWRTESRKPEVKASTLLLRLQELYSIGKSKGLNLMWLEELELVLERAVRRRLGFLVHTLNSVPFSTGWKEKK